MVMMERGGESVPWIDPGLGKIKNIGIEMGGDYLMSPMAVQRGATEMWVEPRQHVHYP